MADVEANIRLVTTGGDESASEVMKADSAVRSLTSASSGMEGQFQHRFQHIGLMLFAGDALRASGLGAETRMVITTLNAALTEGAAVAGISSGGFLLIVTALAALAGIIVKVIDHHKDLLDSLQKTHDAQQKGIESTDKSIASIEAYVAAGGTVTPALQRWLDSEEALRKTQIALQEATDKQTISALKAAIAQEQLGTAANLSLPQKALEVWAALTANTRLGAAAAQRFTEVLNAQTLALEGHKAKLAELQVELANLSSGYTGTLEQAAQALEKTSAHERAMMDVRINSWQEANRKIMESSEATAAFQDNVALHSTQLVKQYNAGLYKAIEADQKSQTQKAAAEQKKWADTAKQDFDRVEGYFGSAVAKMLVEGESFSKAMQVAFQQMVEQMIEMIIKLIAEWMLFEAMTGLGGGAGMFAANMFPQFAGGHATGGSVMADQPTMAMFGEAGPETATFTPLGAAPGGEGMGGGATNITINVTANGVNDPNEMARLIGPALIQEIRGMGQLNFSRA